MFFFVENTENHRLLGRQLFSLSFFSLPAPSELSGLNTEMSDPNNYYKEEVLVM